jgi:hypothetical protein
MLPDCSLQLHPLLPELSAPILSLLIIAQLHHYAFRRFLFPAALKSSGSDGPADVEGPLKASAGVGSELSPPGLCVGASILAHCRPAGAGRGAGAGAAAVALLDSAPAVVAATATGTRWAEAVAGRAGLDAAPCGTDAIGTPVNGAYATGMVADATGATAEAAGAATWLEGAGAARFAGADPLATPSTTLYCC